MRVSIHQPDLFPYSGFWYKLASSDAMVISPHDQFMKRGYQRRVRMRGKWCSLPLVGNPHLVPISEVKASPGWRLHLLNVIRGRYAGSPLWWKRGEDVCERIACCETDSLADINMELLSWMGSELGIRTPLICVKEPPKERGIFRLIEQVQSIGGTEYLSGPGGRAYMGKDPESTFRQAGLGLSWSDHQPTTADSILSVYFDYNDPLAVVMRRLSDGVYT